MTDDEVLEHLLFLRSGPGYQQGYQPGNERRTQPVPGKSRPLQGASRSIEGRSLGYQDSQFPDLVCLEKLLGW
jgi:hypothetical protein